MSDWLSIAAILSAVTLIFAAGKWYGSVNTDRANFKEFMQEIRDKIDQIFLRLPPAVAASQSPVRLTDLGKAISDDLDAVTWANEIAITVKDEVQGKEEYDIQHFSFKYIDDYPYTDEEQSILRKVAYDRGVSEKQVRRVLGIELRDKLLALGLAKK